MRITTVFDSTRVRVPFPENEPKNIPEQAL